MDYIVETDFQGPGFVAVPNHVAQRRGLAPEALGLLVYLASQPRGFIVRWSVICDHFGMGKDRWQRIGRDLRAIGAMQVQEVRGSGGRVIGRRVVVRWPDPMPVEAVGTESGQIPLSDRKPEKPAPGKPAKVSGQIRKSERENPAPYKDKDEKEGTREKAGRAAARCASPRSDATRAATGREGEGAQAPSLTAFQRARLLAGQSVLIDGVPVVPGSPSFEAMAQALRGQDAEKKGASYAA
jgi:hypothetical protein